MFTGPTEVIQEDPKLGLSLVLSSFLDSSSLVFLTFGLRADPLSHFEHKSQCVPCFLTSGSRHILAQPVPGAGLQPSIPSLASLPHAESSNHLHSRYQYDVCQTD